MFKYTLAIIKRKDEVLMLNRNKSPWMGNWNGVGGKIEQMEDPLTSVIREIKEETNITVNNNQISYKGVVTWNLFNNERSGLHLYLVNLSDDFNYETPLKTNEGILDWKSIEWVSSFENNGLSANIPYFIKDVLYDKQPYEHYCMFEDNRLVSVKRKEIVK